MLVGKKTPKINCNVFRDIRKNFAPIKQEQNAIQKVVLKQRENSYNLKLRKQRLKIT